MKRLSYACVTAAMALAFCGISTEASAIPVGWTCTGACGTLGADGVVTAPPGGGSYEYVTSSGGVDLGTDDLNIGSETNGSILLSGLFSATAGELLEFDFNYVTSDGAGYIEYGWAELMNEDGTSAGLLFTARTTPSGDTVPGFGLPATVATITPPSTPIIPGGPAWSPLGTWSGTCYSSGCGYTGWIHSTYEIPTTGNYYLKFGVVNWADEIYDSGMAINGATIGGDPIDDDDTPVPEPATMLLLGTGLLAAGRRALKTRRA